MGCLKLLKVPAGQSAPDDIVHLSLLPRSKVHANPDPSEALRCSRSLVNHLPFLCPRACRCGSPFSTNGPESQSLRHSTCPSSPIPPTSRAPNNVGLCSKADLHGWVFNSLRLPPLLAPILFFPPLGWGGCRAWVPPDQGFHALPCFVRSALFVRSICSLVQPFLLLLF